MSSNGKNWKNYWCHLFLHLLYRFNTTLIVEENLHLLLIFDKAIIKYNLEKN